MKTLIGFLFLLSFGLAPAQTILHDGEITDEGIYLGKHAWHDSASGLPLAEVIYDPGGVLLSYKTWYQGDIMDAETPDPDRKRESLPVQLAEAIYEQDGWGFVKYGEAQGKRVQKGQKVWVMYKGWLQDGTVFDDAFKRGKAFKFTTGKQQVIPGFERAVLQLAPGEGAYVVVPASLAYRGRAIGVIPPFADLIYRIEVQEVR